MLNDTIISGSSPVLFHKAYYKHIDWPAVLYANQANEKNKVPLDSVFIANRFGPNEEQIMAWFWSELHSRR